MQRRRIGDAGIAAVEPVLDVVAVQEVSVAATGKAASVVAQEQAPTFTIPPRKTIVIECKCD